MIVLDTNVISALMQPTENPLPIAWLDRQGQDRLWTTAVNIMEVVSGLGQMPVGRRRRELTNGFENLVAGVFSGRVLDLDLACAREAGRIFALTKAAGQNIGTADSQIAGIALMYGAIVATRNTADFKGIGLDLVNPWEA